MGLSNERNPKETVTTFQVLLEIASNLKVLAEDPNILEKTIKDAYALTAVEQEKVDKAKAETSKYEALIAEQKANIDKLSELSSQTDAKKLELDKIQENLDKIRESYSVQEKKLNEQKLALLSDKKDFQAEKDALEKEKSLLSKDRQLLDQKILETTNLENALRAKADQLKVLTEGL